jgi:hypothetical protein
MKLPLSFILTLCVLFIAGASAEQEFTDSNPGLRGRAVEEAEDPDSLRLLKKDPKKKAAKPPMMKAAKPPKMKAAKPPKMKAAKPPKMMKPPSPP